MVVSFHNHLRLWTKRPQCRLLLTWTRMSVLEVGTVANSGVAFGHVTRCRSYVRTIVCHASVSSKRSVRFSSKPRHLVRTPVKSARFLFFNSTFYAAYAFGIKRLWSRWWLWSLFSYLKKKKNDKICRIRVKVNLLPLLTPPVGRSTGLIPPQCLRVSPA